MAEIILAKARGVALVDDADLVIVSGRSWRLFINNGHPYAATARNGVLMHRLILAAQSGQRAQSPQSRTPDESRRQETVGGRMTRERLEACIAGALLGLAWPLFLVLDFVLKVWGV
jgi:hypothetical protein